MGQAKNEQIIEHEDKETKWAFVAAKKGFNCEMCGNLIGFWERDVYFMSDGNRCSACEHIITKED